MCLRCYRGFSLEVQEEFRATWSVTIRGATCRGNGIIRLHSSGSQSLASLLAEARAFIDQQMEGRSLGGGGATQA